MVKGVGKAIYESIKENKWLDVDYQSDDGVTHFWIAVKNIDIKNKRISAKMINVFIDRNKIIDVPLFAEKIIKASIIKGSYFEADQNLLDKIDLEYKYANWLELNQFNDNILKYIAECNRLDNDPYIKDSYAFGELSYERLSKADEIKVSDEDMNTILDIIVKLNKEEAEDRQEYLEFGMNKLSVSTGEKDYVIAYYNLYLDFSTKTIHLSKKPTINKSFLIEGRKYSLFSYIDCDANVFIDTFSENYESYKEMISGNLRKGEKINTREEIFLLRRDYIVDIEALGDSIIKMEENDELSKPIRAYFGQNISRKKAKLKDPYIVLKSKDANIDQIRAVYNSMTNFITYVEGPPGTGKTKTIVNVILSAMANNMTCLICSNNNKPINDIYDSIKFKYEKRDGVMEDIPFPIIRIGNNEENAKAILTIREFYNQALKYKFLNEKLTLNSKEKALASYSKLKEFIDTYEDKIILDERLRSLNKLKKGISNNGILESINQKITQIENELKKYDDINDSNIKKYVISAWDNKDYLNYLFFNSQIYIKRILSEKNANLVEIIKMDDEEERLKKFNKYLSNDDNIKNFISIFPFVLSTNIAANKIGSNKIHFDLCIMDEAGQCNIATSLIPIVRAKALLMLGDTNQLKPVIVLENRVNELLMDKFNIPEDYNYLTNSILGLMRNKDKTSKNIILRYHYRCPKKIIDYCNQSFYNGELIVENKNDAKLTLLNVENYKSLPGKRNCYEDEARNIVKIIAENKYDDCVVITPFKNQADLINYFLKQCGITNVTAGTIHTVQGAEKNTVILSSALSKNTAERTFDWLKNNEQLLNVGISRAKKEFMMVVNKEALEKLDKGENSGLMQLANYVLSNGDIRALKPIESRTVNFSNNSTAEAELYETLRPFFETSSTLKYKKNQPVKEVLKLKDNIPFEDYYNKAEFDAVIYKRDVFGNLAPILIIELDGGEHICCEKTVKRDRKKEIICGSQKIKLLRIPNSLSKDFEYLISVLKAITEEKEEQHNLLNMQ